MSYNIPKYINGLSESGVLESRKKFGSNKINTGKTDTLWSMLWNVVKEPMLLILIAISVIYVIVGDYAEAIFMFGAIIAVSAISFFQESRSKKALEELKKLNEPLSSVIRNSEVIKIPTDEIVVGDYCIVEEGKMINADGKVIYSTDFSVNEAVLTGESFPVFKHKDSEDNQVYSGTLVEAGLAIIEVEKVGNETQLGAIGESLETIKESKSPLQLQIIRFVNIMAVIGVLVFLLVCLVSYRNTGDWVESLLVGLTLAMSILPEEIPVAFTTFMALGAWKLMREGIIVKRSNIIETLGSTTVICSDKTGTITQNTMHLKALYHFKSDQLYEEDKYQNPDLKELTAYAMWSCEPVPFNPMDIALHQVYTDTHSVDERKNFHLIHEYSLEGVPPLMTHIFENKKKERIIAVKGAPEALIASSDLTERQREALLNKVKELAQKGYRILGIGKAEFSSDDFPEKQQDFNFEFLGLTVFYDPPKEGIETVFKKIYNAGVQLKIITGDNKETTWAIANQTGVKDTGQIIQGAEIEQISEEQLPEIAVNTTLFTRMFPEAKLKVVNALKEKGEVVAMLGDGVNDAPALKAAHIGVAMGNKGTEIAKAAASLIIPNDDLGVLIKGIAAGRRIYTNIKKAVQYIISIHIPIILAVSLPLFLGWIYPEIFTPVHVIFLELIMGPICSIVYENEPMEKNSMNQKPRKMSDTFLNGKELTISIVQGLVITAGILFAYQWSAGRGGTEEQVRAMVFVTLIFANIFLSFANRSFYYSIFETLKNKNNLLTIITLITIIMLIAILYVPMVRNFFKIAPLNITELSLSFVIAASSVLWLEIYKLIKRKGNPQNSI